MSQHIHSPGPHAYIYYDLHVEVLPTRPSSPARTRLGLHWLAFGRPSSHIQHPSELHHAVDPRLANLGECIVVPL